MADITLYKRNELHVGVDTSPSIWYELNDKFRFQPQGYKHMPQYKKGTWDGYISLADIRNRQFPVGLIPELIAWAKEQQYSLQFDKSHGTLLQQFDTAEFLDNWDEWARFEPYDYQLSAIEQAFKLNRALILSPTGSGKSMIAAGIVNYVIRHTDHNILITVPSTQLVEQLAGDIRSYLPDGQELDIQLIYGNADKTPKARIVISTWQSAYRQRPSWFQHFQAYICDEAHQADGKSISSIVNNLASTAILRIGMTGTLDGSKCHEMQLRALFGPVVRTMSTRQLMDNGNLTALSINCHVLQYATNPQTKDYQSEIDYIVANPSRLDAVVDIAGSLSGNTLVLFNYVDKHGIPLYNKAFDAMKDKEVFYISGMTPVNDREQIRHKFQTQNNIVLFASYGTFSAGINAPNLRNLVLAHPTKARIRTLQSIGRALRKSAGKQEATLVDIVDDFKPKSKHKNITFRHFIERLRIYEEERFSYKITQVPLDNE